jgi:hypothetical protein
MSYCIHSSQDEASSDLKIPKAKHPELFQREFSLGYSPRKTEELRKLSMRTTKEENQSEMVGEGG